MRRRLEHASDIVGEALQDMAASSRTLFYYAFAAHAMGFGIGLWLAR